jgi:hypothetical protein
MKAVKVWITIVFLLFVLVQIYQWVKGFILPLPIYVFAGAFLAIASNYDKGISNLFRQASQKEEKLSQTATLVDSIDSIEGSKKDSSALPASD